MNDPRVDASQLQNKNYKYNVGKRRAKLRHCVCLLRAVVVIYMFLFTSSNDYFIFIHTVLE